jgi:hypothetical protein
MRRRKSAALASPFETPPMEVTPEMFEMLEAIYEPPVPAELEGAVLSVDDGVTAAPAAEQPGPMH